MQKKTRNKTHPKNMEKTETKTSNQKKKKNTMPKNKKNEKTNENKTKRKRKHANQKKKQKCGKTRKKANTLEKKIRKIYENNAIHCLFFLFLVVFFTFLVCFCCFFACFLHCDLNLFSGFFFCFTFFTFFTNKLMLKFIGFWLTGEHKSIQTMPPLIIGRRNSHLSSWPPCSATMIFWRSGVPAWSVLTFPSHLLTFSSHPWTHDGVGASSSDHLSSLWIAWSRVGGVLSPNLLSYLITTGWGSPIWPSELSDHDGGFCLIRPSDMLDSAWSWRGFSHPTIWVAWPSKLSWRGGVLLSDHLICLILTMWGSLIQPSQLPDHKRGFVFFTRPSELPDHEEFLKSKYLGCLTQGGCVSFTEL